MSTTLTAATPATPTAATPGRARRAWSDTGTLTLRILLYYRHSPGIVVTSLAAPLIMLVVFGYIFGSAMQVPGGGDYREYLMPGLFVLVAVNGVMPAMVGAARDIGRGVTDRLRSMPVSRPAVLLGQTLADVLVSIAVLAMMVGVGLTTGWRIRTGVLSAAAGLALLVLFRFTMNWVGIFLGLLVAREDTAGQMTVLVFPFAMVTNVFVPTDGLPTWLKIVAEWNPISAVAAAVRTLFGNPRPLAADAPWPLHHPVGAALVWCGALLAVFVPLAVRRFTTYGR